jgi:hypothetical protein
MDEKKYNEFKKDKIINKWLIYSSINKEDLDWLKEKQLYWNKHKEHLEEKGFVYDSNISSALEKVKTTLVDPKDGCLLIVKIGSDNFPASKQEIKEAEDLFKNAFANIPGVIIIITHHSIDVQKIDIKQLKKIQSKIFESCLPDQNENPIYDIEL